MKNRKLSQPMTHSDILWHFTGGPRWSLRQNKQLNRKKSNKEAFEALINILRDRELKVGSYHEVVNIRVPEKVEYENGRIFKKKNYLVNLATSRVCCVADIPEDGLDHHANRYGKIAIGFKRSSLIKAGFNPVLYTFEDKDLVKYFYNAQNVLELIDGSASSIIEELGAEVETILNENNIEESIDFSEAASAVEEIQSYTDESLESLKSALAFIKTFSKKEFDSIYSEREWRSTKDFKFTIKDVSCVLLPRNYANRLENKITENIEVRVWEDIFKN